jgi:septal ring-binding cell division protein DamX
MTLRPTHALPSVSPAEMEFLVTRTGLTLNAGQMADLVLAWRQLSTLIATIPREAKPADDCAFVFRLPPPAAAQARKPAAVPRAAPKEAATKPPAAKTRPAKAPATKAPTAKAPTAKTRPAKTRSAKPPAAKPSAAKPAARKPAAGKSVRAKPRSRK